ncbi:MAG: hypothetical protein LBU55_00950 [Elusimicrobiota bacterium]|jgi:lipopolysaccharide export system protein LptA|nr:hypothetical protein [Elusimicrobiota bacterium]
MQKTFILSFMVLIFPVFVFSYNIEKKTILTGDTMEILNNGEIAISKGNSKAINGGTIITADKMAFNEKNSTVKANGNVKMVSQTQDKLPIVAKGKTVFYSLKSQMGSFSGDMSQIEYFVKNSTVPASLKAKSIYVDKNNENAVAFKNVEVFTSSGAITSDNAFYFKKHSAVLFKKDAKRPIADVFYDGKKGKYEADAMVFYNLNNSKKIIMYGNIVGKIEMENIK